MAKQRYINTRFWIDDYISNLDPIEKLLFLYCLTNPATDISGVYEIPIKTMAVDTGIDKEMVIKVLKRFEKDKKIKYFEGWIAVKNFIKHQKENPKINKGIELSLDKSPKWTIDYIYNTEYVSPTKNERSIRKKIPLKTREFIFSRDGYVCQICKTTDTSILYELDHIIPFRDGGGNEAENLRVLCQSCNGRRNKEGYEEATRRTIGRLSHSNTNTNTNTNTNDSEPSSQEIPLIIKAFENINPACSKFYGNKTQRGACQSLIDDYGLDRILVIIEKTLPKTNGMEFFPTITTPVQLRDKFVQLESAIRKHQSKGQKLKDSVAF